MPSTPSSTRRNSSVTHRDVEPTDARPDFATLWAEAYPRIRAYVLFFVNSFHDSEDVLQETAMAVAKDFGRYDPSRPFLEWALGIARNRVQQHFRNRDRDRKVTFSDEAVKRFESALLDMEPQYDAYRESLDYCMEMLPPRSRRLLELRHLNCLQPAEISAQVGLTKESVYARLSQIRVALRDCINRRLQALSESV